MSEPAPETGTEEQRITTIADLAAKVDWLVDKLTGDGETPEEPAGEEGADVPSQVRAELARAREEDARRQQAEADKAERESIKEQIAKLRERPPAVPVPRRQRLLGWGD